MSGLAIPTYVVDSPHGGGKIPSCPTAWSPRRTTPSSCATASMLVRYQAGRQADHDPKDRHPRCQPPTPGHEVRHHARKQRADGPAAASPENHPGRGSPQCH
ncbi:MAG: hypothetical protein U0793_22190 [Gemmataceae bacterium]